MNYLQPQLNKKREENLDKAQKHAIQHPTFIKTLTKHCQGMWM